MHRTACRLPLFIALLSSWGCSYQPPAQGEAFALEPAGDPAASSAEAAAVAARNEQGN